MNGTHSRRRGHRGFLDSLRNRRVRVARARDVFSRSAVLHGEHALGEKFTGTAGNDVRAENLPGGLVGEEFHHAFRIVVGPRARVGGERKLTDDVYATLPFFT